MEPGRTEEQLPQWYTPRCPASFPPLLLLGNCSLQILIRGFCAQLDLENILVVKVYKVDIFCPQQRFGNKFQQGFIVLIGSLSTVLLHKTDGLQQIPDEMPFSVWKVDTRSHAMLSALKQLVLSVQTLLADVTLGPYQWNFLHKSCWFYGSVWWSVLCVYIFKIDHPDLLQGLFRCCLLHKIIFNHLPLSSWKHLS